MKNNKNSITDNDYSLEDNDYSLEENDPSYVKYIQTENAKLFKKLKGGSLTDYLIKEHKKKKIKKFIDTCLFMIGFYGLMIFVMTLVLILPKGDIEETIWGFIISFIFISAFWLRKKILDKYFKDS